MKYFIFYESNSIYFKKCYLNQDQLPMESVLKNYYYLKLLIIGFQNL